VYPVSDACTADGVYNNPTKMEAYMVFGHIPSNLARSFREKRCGYGGWLMKITKAETEIPQTPSTYTEPTTGMEFVYVKGGCYQMGNTFGDIILKGARPVHEVCVDNFWVGKYAVTQGQWQKVMGSNPADFKNGDNYPVEMLSWEDAQRYLRKLSESGGKRYRLPTEAEWEYAARSGGKEEKYSGGDDIDSVAWYKENSGNQTHPVGQKMSNGLGIYDMCGNVWEWVEDWYGEYYYSCSPRDNPCGPSSGEYRALRGGSWFYRFRCARTSFRGRNIPAGRYYCVGFRAAFSAK